MPRPHPPTERPQILEALRSLRGRATVGDVVAATGFPADEVRAELKALLEGRQGHLAVTDSGEMVYEFHPRLLERGAEPTWRRLRRAGWEVFRKLFRAWIVVMLVAYFVLFVVLVVAALAASARGGGERRGGGGWGEGRRHGGGLSLGDVWAMHWLLGRGWRPGRPYYGRRWERRMGGKVQVPFHRKVFAFVFGPDRPEISREERDREVLELLRARKGVLATAELVQQTGLPLPDAEEEMARLVATYDGEPVVSPGGELAYAFPGLLRTVQHRIRWRIPKPAWQRLEPPGEVTGNSVGSNLAIVAINLFNLAAAASAPWLIFPPLGLGGPAAYLFLVFVPLVYSLLFFGVPAVRALGVWRENARRRHRNVRHVLLGLVYDMTLRKGAGVQPEAAREHVARRLEGRWVERAEVVRALEEIAAEFDAEVEPDAEGEPIYRFPRLREQFAAAEAVRKVMALDRQLLGEIVYHTGDGDARAGRRDLEAFDRALAEARRDDLGRYVSDPGAIAFEEEWERALASGD